ncbi:Polar amino acid transport system permease protein OS=Castellaniella defragrans OX=75697 GN=HNR28_001211 PE=3 SV=1 [Castellaniella defragrans]
MIHSFNFEDLLFLLRSAGWTLVLTLVATAIGGTLALAISMARVSTRTALREVTRLYIIIVQGIPVLMVLFLSYYGLAQAGLDLPPIVAASLALSIYVSAYLGDIWRGAIQSVHRQQWEASASLALTRMQQYRYVILPQSVRIALPPTVGFLVQLVKNTSIVSIVSVIELTRAGQLVNNITFEPFKVFITVALIYLIICYPMSRLSRYLEEKSRVYRDR